MEWSERSDVEILRAQIWVTLALSFYKGLKRGKTLLPHRMIKAAERQMKALLAQHSGPQPQFDAIDALKLQLEAIRYTHHAAADLYVDYIRGLLPALNARRGRPRAIDNQIETLLRTDLTHLKKAKLLGLPAQTLRIAARPKTWCEKE